MSAPRLIEYSAKDYMSNVLQNCHETRVNIYLYLLNFGVLILFIGITVLVLYYCYRNKRSPTEEKEKQIKEQEYILSKIRYYKNHQQNIASKASITGLPVLDLPH